PMTRLPPPCSSLFPYTRSSDLPAVVVQHHPYRQDPVLDRMLRVHEVEQDAVARDPARLRAGSVPALDGLVRIRDRGAEPLLHLRSEEHTSELQSRENLVCRLLL